MKTTCTVNATRMPAFYKNNNASENHIVKGEKLKYYQDKSLGVHLLECLEAQGQLISQVDPITGDFTTFNDMRAQSVRVARALRRRSIGDGDVVSVCSYNHLDTCLPVIGALFVGAAVAPLHPALPRPDLKHLLSITKPKIIFCDQLSIERIQKSLEELKLSIELVIFGTTRAHTSFDCLLSEDHADDDDDSTFAPVSFGDPYNHIAFIVPTTGTKDLPKGVSISHGNVLHHLQCHWDSDWHGISMLNVSTLYTIAGIKSMLACIDHGTINIITPQFEAGVIAKIIDQWRGDLIVIITASHYVQLINSEEINKPDLAHVKMVIVHGKNVTEEQFKTGESLFSKAHIYLGYGMTETLGMVCSPTEKKYSIGVPDPDVEIKIIHEETGRTVGPHVLGELYIRGNRVMMGYYNDLTATVEAIDKDGWLRTGDIGYYDQDHCFFVKGSITERFVYRNCEIMPPELEEILLEHPEIMEVCVVGVRHRLDGARAKAFIVRDETSNISETRIRRYLEGRVSPSKHLHGGIIFIEKLPLTPTGKVNRRKLLKIS